MLGPLLVFFQPVKRLTSVSLYTNHIQARRQGGTGESNNGELGQEGRGHGMERGSVFPR